MADQQLVAAPGNFARLAIFLADYWLSKYAIRITVDGWYFIVPLVFIVLIAFTTVLSNTINAILANPADHLKEE